MFYLNYLKISKNFYIYLKFNKNIVCQASYKSADVPFRTLKSMSNAIIKQVLPETKPHRVSLNEGRTNFVQFATTETYIRVMIDRNGWRSGFGFLLDRSDRRCKTFYIQAKVCRETLHKVRAAGLCAPTRKASLWQGKFRAGFSICTIH